VITAGSCIEASFKRCKGEAGVDAYQGRPWGGWQHHMTLTLIAGWVLMSGNHRGEQLPPALSLPPVRYGLSMLLLEVFCTPGMDSICHQVQRQLLRNALARFYHHRTRKCIPPRGSVHMTQDTCGKQVLPTSPKACKYKKSKADVSIPANRSCSPSVV